MSDRYADLERLHRLKEAGALSEEEFLREKDRLLTAPPGAVRRPFWGMERDTYAMLLHVSYFAGYVVPVAGWVLPIVMWIAAKDQDEAIDRHGRIVINWMISSLIYGVLFGILVIVLIGIPLLFALGICVVLFPILGAVRANDGVVWRYPFSIPFLRVRGEEELA